MTSSILPSAFFDHRRHTLKVYGVDTLLDVLAFHGEERLSHPFKYLIEFTCTDRDLAVDHILGKPASFSLCPVPPKRVVSWQPPPEIKPLRTLTGVVTGFKRLSGSKDEARYEITLEPRLALLAQGKQFRIYQHQSVPQIVEHILRSRHDFEGQDFYFQLLRDYPRREQVMQYDESDLAFISRLLADVGIWYRFVRDDRLNLDVVEFHDHQRYYQFDVELPCRPPSGLSSDKDCVWNLQTHHRVVEKHVSVRTYQHRNANAWLNGEIDQTRGATTTYGEAYHYAEPYSEMGDRLDIDEDLPTESGYGYARLRHERYLNDQTRLSAESTSAALAPGQVLTITGGAPQAFMPRVVITQLTTHAGRDHSLQVAFSAIPYSERVCFRPPLQPKPKIAGTVPARVTSTRANDPYAHIDLEGRYKVNFLFDRDSWKLGAESLWLRLARPYAGDTQGLHLPLIAGTEVAVAFEQGDPDRPYIAHALHDSRHPDHVTLRNYKRNVLRTPANNKLRMDDTRGQEHIKLSTEYSGKSQLNLGHIVDAGKQKRGEGFELRSDGWGAVRAGKGLLISTDQQSKASGAVLSMDPATQLVQAAAQHIADCQAIAQAHRSQPPSLDGLQHLQTDAKDLTAPAILLSAPKGIGAVTPASLLLKSGDALYLQSHDELNLAAARRLTAHANQGISLLAQQQGMRLVSGKGPLEIESHGDLMNLIAQQDITVQSVQGQLHLTAKNGITLGCGGGYLRINSSGEIDIHTPGKLLLKGQHVWEPPAGQSFMLRELPQSVCEECLKEARENAVGLLIREG